MRWDRFFEDLEDQAASEWEAERAALESEAERLRLSKLTLIERIGVLTGEEVAVELADATVLRAVVGGLGADWMLLAPWSTRGGAALVPLASIDAIALAHDALLRSARPGEGASALSRRATLGYALRDLVRRRVGVTVHTSSGRAVSGTIDRAGADHLDLALHEPGAVRRASEVAGYRIVPFAAIVWIAIDGPGQG
jgi:hypothetical protein